MEKIQSVIIRPASLEMWELKYLAGKRKCLGFDYKGICRRFMVYAVAVYGLWIMVMRDVSIVEHF